MRLFITTLLFFIGHGIALASIPSQPLNVAPSAPVTPPSVSTVAPPPATSPVSAVTRSSAPPSSSSQLACERVCSRIKSRLAANKSSVQTEYKQWQERLGVKKDQDIVTYDRTEQEVSAAEALLEFMVRHFRPHQERGPRTQMNPSFLTYMMLKCFPEAYEDQTHARMSKLVDTIWTARNMNIEKDISSCQ